MTTALVCIPAPEERDFGYLEGEIRLRQMHIQRLEREIAPLLEALEAFEWEYKARVGTLQRELLDLRSLIETIESRTGRIHARLAADPDGILGDLFTRDELAEIGEMFGIEIPPSWFAAHDEDDRLERERAWRFSDEDTRNRAEEEEILRRMQRQHRPRMAEDERKELRRLYLEMARLCHPDLATDEADRTRREELMLRINEAWQMQNLQALREIERDRGAVLGWKALNSWAERVIWARRECVRLDGQILAMTERLQSLRASDTFPLWFNRTLGNSVISQRSTTLRIDIANAHHRLDEAKDAFRQALRYYAGAIA
jgi:hypothetical protein